MRPDAPRSLHRIDVAIAAGLTAAAFLIYLTTLTPSLSYASPDGNELATIPYLLGLAHSPGYPLYTWLGKLFTLLPVGDVAHRLNLMSAILGALAVGGLYAIIASLLDGHPALRRSAAALAALLFAFSLTFWSQAVIAEVYAPNLAMVALTLLALLRWERTGRALDLFFFALAFGFSLGIHLSDLGFAPAFALFLLLTHPRQFKRPTSWLAGAAGFVVGAAQFLWLPLRAGTLSDRMMLERAPTSLAGIYRYTLGAFTQMRFAFPLSALPDRVVIYLDLLLDNLGCPAILLGLIGLVALLLRRPRHYFLFVGMYLVNVWFFIQYAAFDLEVFFLPAHFLWAIFLGFGLAEIFSRLGEWMRRLSAPTARQAAPVALALAAPLFALIPLVRHHDDNNRSRDTALNDFYANVWELLPQDSALLTQSGVFGYDAFYWRLVYGTRPDVLLPALPSSLADPRNLQDRDLYATTPLSNTRQPQGPGALAPGNVPAGLWQVPVLIGRQDPASFAQRGALVLYHVTDQHPNMVAEQAAPRLPLAVDFGPAVLVGADVDPSTVESGGRLHLVLYWRAPHPGGYRISTSLGGWALEEHVQGFGNLERYEAEVRPVGGGVIVEDYWVVIPSTVEQGSYTLSVRLAGISRPGVIGQVTVVNSQEAMERWLDVAGLSEPAP